jgi:carbamoyltransferase
MNLDGGRKSAQFMTMTFDAKKEFIDNCKAACHIDNTARPQILTKENDAFAYKLIEEYNKKTGKKALINTSFNLHNYPIIYEEKVGIESWEQSGCEILIIENVAFELKNPEKHE